MGEEEAPGFAGGLEAGVVGVGDQGEDKRRYVVREAWD